MKKKLLNILLLAAILLTYAFLNEKSSIEGRITEEDTGTPLSFAFIKLFMGGKLITGTQSDVDGNYTIRDIDPGIYDLVSDYIGYQSNIKSGLVLNPGKNVVNFVMKPSQMNLECIVITEYKAPLKAVNNTAAGATVTAEKIKNLKTKSVNSISATTAGVATDKEEAINIRGGRTNATAYYVDGVRCDPKHEINKTKFNDNTETYQKFQENKFISPLDESLSTFSIDVDRESYSIVRRFLNSGQLPPQDAVRIEEMVNYFDYNYALPKSDDPFFLYSSLIECPWNNEHRVLHLALNTRKVDKSKLPASNFVFLIDVSGSMDEDNKLPLVRSSMKLLTDQLRSEDKVAIVVYAGSAGCVLPSTPVSEKKKIIEALENLRAGGSTAGGAGIQLAYKIAKENFIAGGNNRVVLATDGDFNVGVSDNQGLEDLISSKREENIFLSVLGYGMGNYKSDKMQILADKGNGIHAYIDDIQEARKILIKEFTGSMFTLAKDVKIQIEFNPALVSAYRLIGYENRMLEKEDFNNDVKDAGEIGVGHSVTALYEIVPAGSKSTFPGIVDPLKFQENKKQEYKNKTDLAFFKVRYKEPEGSNSKKIEQIISPVALATFEAPESSQFALAVAEFGMLLRGSEYRQNSSYKNVIDLALSASKNIKIGEDSEGSRTEFITLVKTAMDLSSELSSK
ncbi:MAG: YfbK domain-containing protein [Deltaproteobacteria bacterium]